MTFTREFNQARKEQGFKSQAQLDAFYAKFDHQKNCAACHALNSHAALDDGMQPTAGECVVAQNLYRAYLAI